MKKFSLEEYLKHPDWKVVTKSRKPVRILCTDRKISTGECIIGLVEDLYTWEKEIVMAWTKDGNCGNLFPDFELYFLPETHEGYVNLYKSPEGVITDTHVYATKENAESRALSPFCASDYIGTYKVEWEEY